MKTLEITTNLLIHFSNESYHFAFLVLKDLGIWAIFFIVGSVLNILYLIKKWQETGDKQISAILGWVCAIFYSVFYNLNIYL